MLIMDDGTRAYLAAILGSLHKMPTNIIIANHMKNDNYDKAVARMVADSDGEEILGEWGITDEDAEAIEAMVVKELKIEMQYHTKFGRGDGR